MFTFTAQKPAFRLSILWKMVIQLLMSQNKEHIILPYIFIYTHKNSKTGMQHYKPPTT